MSSKDEAARIFVGGLSWDTTERHLESTFGRFGKVIDVQIMVERDTGRPRGFGFVTFADERAVEDAISDMHGRELDGRLISVNKAEPKVASDGPGYGYGGSAYSSGSRGYSGDRPPPVGRSECFKCGRPGHWARDCTAAGGGGGRFSSRSRYSPGSTGGGAAGGGGRGDRFAGSDRYADRYAEDRYDGGRYGDRDRYDGGRYGDRDRTDSRDTRYGGGRDRYGGERYAPSDRYGGPDRTERYPQNGYSKERSGYDRDGPARGGADRYASGGPARNGGGGYRERPGPYDRPSRGGRGSSYDDRY